MKIKRRPGARLSKVVNTRVGKLLNFKKAAIIKKSCKVSSMWRVSGYMGRNIIWKNFSYYRILRKKDIPVQSFLTKWGVFKYLDRTESVYGGYRQGIATKKASKRARRGLSFFVMHELQRKSALTLLELRSDMWDPHNSVEDRLEKIKRWFILWEWLNRYEKWYYTSLIRLKFIAVDKMYIDNTYNLVSTVNPHTTRRTFMIPIFKRKDKPDGIVV